MGRELKIENGELKMKNRRTENHPEGTRPENRRTGEPLNKEQRATDKEQSATDN
jgi:hypothetical protein